MSGRRNRRRTPAVAIELAEFHQIPAVLALCRTHGEKHVDIRQTQALKRAIAERRFYVLIDLHAGDIVGCAGVYPYRVGPNARNELGTNVLKPQWRGRGLADLIVALRAIGAMINHPGSTCVSELYLDSVKSKAVLERNGFVEVEPDEGMIAHALAASTEPVLHMRLLHSAVPYLASLLSNVADSGVLKHRDIETQVVLPTIYWLSTASGRELLAELVQGDLRSIQAGGDEGCLPRGDLPPPARPARSPKRPH
jgi:N-acetylglutamate synthase-like GNAT family acetyltransferase